MSFPMPGRSRRSAALSEATRRVSCATVSLALRYARILKGFSPLISRRSPISARTRAIARLSTGAVSGGDAAFHPQAVPFDGEVEETRPAGRERGANGGDVRRRAEAEQ